MSAEKSELMNMKFDVTIDTVRLGDEVLVTNKQIRRFIHGTETWDNPDMGGTVIGFDDHGFPNVQINQTPAAYEHIKGCILSQKDYIFKWRKISFAEHKARMGHV